MKSKLFKNSAIYIFGDVLNKSIPFFMLPVLTRYLSPSDYGLISIFAVLVSVMAVFTGLSVHGAVNVNFFRISKDKLSEYIGNVLFILCITTMVILIFSIFFHKFISNKTNIPSEWIIVAVIVASSQFITTINLVLWMAQQRPKAYSLYQLGQTVFITFFSILFIIAFKMNWEGQLLAQSSGTILFAGISLLFIVKRNFVTFKLNREYIYDALKFGIPLVPHALAAWVKTGADRMILMSLIGSQATGIYSVAYQLGMVISVVVTAFNKAWNPYLFRVLSSEPSVDEKKMLVKITYIYFFMLLIFVLSFTLAVKYIVPFFLGSSFETASQYIFYIAIAFAFQGMYLMVTNYIFYIKKTHILAYVTFTTAALHVTLSYFLILSNGAIGAAQAMSISFFVTFIATWILSSRVYKMPWMLRSEK